MSGHGISGIAAGWISLGNKSLNFDELQYQVPLTGLDDIQDRP
jgi:hypothetical protein